MAGKVVIGIRERRHHHRDLQAHLDGRARPKTALGAETCRDRRGREPVVMLAGDPDAAQAALDAHRERLKTTPGRRPNEVIELMLAGPPPFEIERDKHGREVGVEPWPADRVDEWAECALAWLRVVIGPDAVLEGFWFHADEKSPHVHASVIPACDGRLSWKACLERFAQSYLGTGNVHHRRLYAALRDSYHESVGVHFGLARGEVGRELEPEDRAKPTPIDRADAARHEERAARAERNELQRECKELEGHRRFAAAHYDELLVELTADLAQAAAREEDRARDARRAVEEARRERDQVRAATDRALEEAIAARDAAQREQKKACEARAEADAMERQRDAARVEVDAAEARVRVAHVQVQRDEARAREAREEEARAARAAAAEHERADVARAEWAELESDVDEARASPTVRLVQTARDLATQVTALARELEMERARYARLRAAVPRMLQRTRRRTWALARGVFTAGFSHMGYAVPTVLEALDAAHDIGRLTRKLARDRRRAKVTREPLEAPEIVTRRGFRLPKGVIDLGAPPASEPEPNAAARLPDESTPAPTLDTGIREILKPGSTTLRVGREARAPEDAPTAPVAAVAEPSAPVYADLGRAPGDVDDIDRDDPATGEMYLPPPPVPGVRRAKPRRRVASDKDVGR